MVLQNPPIIYTQPVEFEEGTGREMCLTGAAISARCLYKRYEHACIKWGTFFLNELIVATKEFRNYKRKVYNTSSHLTRPKGACQRDLNAMMRPH